MAEENIVIPRDKYNRMLEQLKSVKDNKPIQSTDNKEGDESLISHYDKINTAQRARGDITHKETDYPPGLKHDDINTFIKKLTKKKRKHNHTITRDKCNNKTADKRNNKTSKQHNRKSKLKANWIRVFK